MTYAVENILGELSDRNFLGELVHNLLDLSQESII